MRSQTVSLGRGLAIGGLIVLICWLLWLIWSIGGKAEIAWQSAYEAKNQYASLEERKAMLEAQSNSLSSPLGQDAAIRQAFGVAKPGEEVIVVVPPTTAPTTASVSWWRSILNWF